MVSSILSAASGAHNCSDSSQRHPGSFLHCFLFVFSPHLLSLLAAGVVVVTTVPGALWDFSSISVALVVDVAVTMASSTLGALDAAASGAHSPSDSFQKHPGSFLHFFAAVPPHFSVAGEVSIATWGTFSIAAQARLILSYRQLGSFEHSLFDLPAQGMGISFPMDGFGVGSCVGSAVTARVGMPVGGFGVVGPCVGLGVSARVGTPVDGAAVGSFVGSAVLVRVGIPVDGSSVGLAVDAAADIATGSVLSSSTQSSYLRQSGFPGENLAQQSE